MTKQDKVTFSWNIHWVCNYDCPYCWFHGNWDNFKDRNKYFNADDLSRAFERLYNMYGEISLNILGGEPLVYPDFVTLVKKLSRYCRIGTTTNLSIDISEEIKDVDIMKVGFVASFHPLFADLEVFMRRVKFLKSMRILERVAYLAYPPQIDRIPLYKDIFTREGFIFDVIPFWGKFEQNDYPESYSDSEREIMETSLCRRRGVTFKIGPKIVEKGSLCKAGQYYAVILPDGSVKSCGSQEDSSVIGHILDKNFKLNSEPKRCVTRRCTGNEGDFLEGEDD